MVNRSVGLRSASDLVPYFRNKWQKYFPISPSPWVSSAMYPVSAQKLMAWPTNYEQQPSQSHNPIPVQSTTEQAITGNSSNNIIFINSPPLPSMRNILPLIQLQSSLLLRVYMVYSSGILLLFSSPWFCLRNQIKMGGQHSQENKPKNNSQNRSRFREFPMALCQPSHNQQQQPRVLRQVRALSDSMRSSNMDILNQLNEENMPHYSVKLIHYLLTFLSVRECLDLRMVSRKLKNIIDTQSNIYANALCWQMLRKVQLRSFVEYGSDSRFQQLFTIQMLKIELNQDESWVRIYQQLLESKKTIKVFEDKMRKNFDVQLDLSQFVASAIQEPMLPVAILTSDILKKSTTSWFQLALTQETIANLFQDNILDEVVEVLRQDCIGMYSIQNMCHAQLLMELRWLIMDNYISHPSTIQGPVPKLLEFTTQILHAIYLRCLFSRNVLMLVKATKTPTSLLNYYNILWKSYMGIIFGMNRLFEKLATAIDSVFNIFFSNTREAPKFSFISAMGRIWAQIVLKGSKRQDLDPLESDLLISFSELFKEKRYRLLEFFTKDLVESQRQPVKEQFKDAYFKQRNFAIDKLLSDFASAALDVSLHEQSAHWIGHSECHVGQFYSILLKQLMEESHNLYERASPLFEQNFNTFQEYILADAKYLEEIVNTQTAQIYIKPIGLSFLYEKIKINLRQHVLSIQIANISILQNDEVEESNQILESQILPPDQRVIQEIEPTEIQLKIERSDDILEKMVTKILAEEKIIGLQPVVAKVSGQYVQSKVISMYGDENIQSKMRQLSKYSTSSRGSQVTQIPSHYSQLVSSYRPELATIKAVASRLEQVPWSKYLRQIQKIEVENDVQILKRNNEVEMRNQVKQIQKTIHEDLEKYLDFLHVWCLEDAMALSEQRERAYEQYECPQRTVGEYVAIQSGGETLADCITNSK